MYIYIPLSIHRLQRAKQPNFAANSTHCNPTPFYHILTILSCSLHSFFSRRFWVHLVANPGEGQVLRERERERAIYPVFESSKWLIHYIFLFFFLVYPPTTLGFVSKSRFYIEITRFFLFSSHSFFFHHLPSLELPSPSPSPFTFTLHLSPSPFTFTSEEEESCIRGPPQTSRSLNSTSWTDLHSLSITQCTKG